jgi:hypothetical protein
MPKPEFAPSDQIERRGRVWNDFLEHVLGLPWALVTDGSRLADFEGLMPRDELERRILRRYGLLLTDAHLELPLFAFLDLLQPPLQA